MFERRKAKSRGHRPLSWIRHGPCGSLPVVGEGSIWRAGQARCRDRGRPPDRAARRRSIAQLAGDYRWTLVTAATLEFKAERDWG